MDISSFWSLYAPERIRLSSTELQLRSTLSASQMWYMRLTTLEFWHTKHISIRGYRAKYQSDRITLT